MPSTTSALHLDTVCKSFGTTVAVDHVSLEIAPSECVALVGESGSGKSTLLRMCNALVTPDEGQVFIDGEPIAGMDDVLLRRRIGYVPQDGGLLPHWRVLRNVMLVPWLLGARDAESAALRAFALVGLDAAEFGNRWPDQLSGGQRQRVALARALAAQPRHLLLDEAFGALDAITRADVRDAFVSVRRATGVTAVLVTHDLAEAAYLADRIAVMRRGRLEQVGSPVEIASAPATDYVRDLVDRATVAASALAGLR